MRVGLIQLNSSDDPAKNLPIIRDHVQQAAASGATFVLTPEVSNCVSQSRTLQARVLRHEADDPVLAGLREVAAAAGIWLLIGSLAVLTKDRDGRFANRSFLISPLGQIVARYDKIHMFDVQLSETETFRESEGYRPGVRAVVADAGFGHIGMTVCYDIRFAQLYRKLAQAGAQILTIPSAFSPVTGVVHWEILLRARAIETGCFVLAPAQTGTHPARQGKPRVTWGHTMAISPWGEVLADAGTESGVTMVDLDLTAVDVARARLPSLHHDRPFESP
ncbi:MAG: carbon-nitrogen hydrolase family protein [Paracoccaceae bacterium]